MNIIFVYAVVLGYLLGSIPFGLLITRVAGLGDIRAIGSGNIGATNVLRTGRRELAAATLLLDALKGTAAVLIARYFWGDQAAMLAGAFAFLGHLYPVWLNFKGGKGTATSIGVLFGLAWPVGLIFCATWLVIAFARRISSLAAITASAVSPIFGYIFGGLPLAATAGLMSIFLVYSHRANISRMLTNTEPKIGEKKAE